MARRAEERVRQSRGSDLDIQHACVYLAREGERERGERESSAWGAMAGV